jgi:DNA-binding transcriptional ArsR family regulator
MRPENYFYLDKKICRGQAGQMLEVEVIDKSDTALVVLDETRTQMLASLAEPQSASMLAASTGLSRQRLNYHLHQLANCGLVRLVNERRKRNMTERLYQATAKSYVISPQTFASVAPDPARSPDQLSASWLLALASKLICDVGQLVKDASRTQKRLGTFSMDTDIRFANATERAAFSKELAASISSLVARYHDEEVPNGRRFRLVLAVHPSIDVSTPESHEGQ